MLALLSQQERVGCFVVYRHTVLPGPASWLNCHTLKLPPVFQGPLAAAGAGSPWAPLASLLEAQGVDGLSQAPEVRRPSHSGLV